MRRWWQDLADLVLPAECGGCGTPRAVLCAECRAALTSAGPRRVRPVPEPRGLPVVCAAAPYQDAVRAVLLAHKERGALGLAGPLGESLAGAVRGVVGRGGGGVPNSGHGFPDLSPHTADAPAPLILVPLPSAPRATRARGHDPTRRIALAAARVLRGAGQPVRVLSVLRQRRPVADQAGLNSRERHMNMAGALHVPAGGARLLAAGAPWPTGASDGSHGSDVSGARSRSDGNSRGDGSRGSGEGRRTSGEGRRRSHGSRGTRGGGGGGGPGTRGGGGTYGSGVGGRSRVVLVDDLMTTGASLSEGARALRAAGTEMGISAAVIAASPDSFDINRN
ncbi:ComF family protein [Streptomyces sp. NPDC058001]|uniref:ComF family protein n=1 Tax=Streptomyces sp. NPDC058001 TaxID=3346300 RepID=UPI0036EDD4F8